MISEYDWEKKSEFTYPMLADQPGNTLSHKLDLYLLRNSYGRHVIYLDLPRSSSVSGAYSSAFSLCHSSHSNVISSSGRIISVVYVSVTQIHFSKSSNSRPSHWHVVALASGQSGLLWNSCSGLSIMTFFQILSRSPLERKDLETWKSNQIFIDGGSSWDSWDRACGLQLAALTLKWIRSDQSKYGTQLTIYCWKFALQ